MRFAVVLMCGVLLTAVLSGREHHTLDIGKISETTVVNSMDARHGDRPGTGKPGNRKDGSELRQAPGVVQFNLFDESRTTWFVTTETIPRGSTIAPFIILPGKIEFQLESRKLTEDIPAGASLVLPSFRRFTDFWPPGIVTYEVVVYIGGVETHAISDYPVRVYRGTDDVLKLVPLVFSVSQVQEGATPVMLMKGVFFNDSPKIVMEDFVVPSEAVIRFTSSEIAVDLTKVPRLDLGLLQEFLVTIGQSGWCDTIVFRFVPLRH